MRILRGLRHLAHVYFTEFGSRNAVNRGGAVPRPVPA